MQKPLLSVIVPVYNVAPYLTRCVNSIINQTYTNLEIILVNDGSTDASGTMCDAFAKKDSRIKVIHKTNGGLVSARKAGLAIASADYATYVDSDDWIEKDAYECLMQYAIKEDCDLVTAGCKRDYNTHCEPLYEPMPSGIYREEKLLTLKQNMIDSTCFYQENIYCCVWAKIFKRSILEEFQNKIDNRIVMAEDAAVTYTLLLNINSVYVSGKTFYHYCIHSDSMAGTKLVDEEMRLKVLFDYMQKEFITHKNTVPNIMLQFELIKYRLYLVRDIEKVVSIKDNMLYPFGKVQKGQKIAVYGAGKFGKSLHEFLIKNGYNVKAWVDKAALSDGTCGDGKTTIVLPQIFQQEKFDKIIIAITIPHVYKGAIQELVNNYNILKENILFLDVSLVQKALLNQ